MNAFQLVEQCYNHLPDNIKREPWLLTDHGRKILTTEEELNAYIAAYGEMHIVKCRAALQNFPFDDIKNFSVEIFDWGCGQGLASLTLIDMLYERGLLSCLKSIFLIEPSSHALNRAVTWVKQNVGPGINVIPINRYIPQNVDERMDDVKCTTRISINLFSNILDVRTLSLTWLAQKTSSLAPTNYVLCVGPKFNSNCNTRVADFCGYFNPQSYFSFINKYPYAYTTKTNHAYGCETRCFVHERNNGINSHYTECATIETYQDPYDYNTDVVCDNIGDGAIEFYNKLRRESNGIFDLYFRPALNCDAVDFVLASRSQGIILINVCNDLSNLDVAFKRIETIKNNIFDLHLRDIKIDSIIYSSIYNCVKVALYFPNNTYEEVNNCIAELNKGKNKELNNKYNNSKDKDFYSHLYRFTNETDLKKELGRIWVKGFKSEYYDEFTRLIHSNWHSYKDGDLEFRLSDKQKSIVRSENARLRVKGVAGCGKTQVVANRAVERHLKTGEKVLIITFNLSLIQYIMMRIKQVPADFSLSMFEITNYHQFFKSKANIYARHHAQLEDFNNAQFFESYKDEIEKYESIIIDEVQDFKTSWIQLIVKYFLKDGGSISLFGDGEQNIYDREMEAETKMPSLTGCGFPGGQWTTMSERISMRILNPRISLLSSKFAREFMGNNDPLHIQNDFLFNEYTTKYWFVNSDTAAETLAGNIGWILSEYKLNTDDVVVLGQTVKLLREVEAAYCQLTHKPTMINFETLKQYELITQRSDERYKDRVIKAVRRAAKTHFTTDCTQIKMSSIHSFKGWESKTIILLLQPDMQSDEFIDEHHINKRDNIPALIYTALTRAKGNLFIINMGNKYYHKFFQENI